MGRLKQLELENFKSYAGKQIVGPFDDFTCIIGPNGAGKSNMMDAISFVLGVQSKHLRSSHLKELIFRKDGHSAPARRASVKLIYETSDGEMDGIDGQTEVSFSRSVSSTGVSTYRIDNNEVTYESYESVLQSIGVLVKARNFLVFQGDVESVAAKSPAELTKLFEQIAGSDILKEEYDALLRRKNEIEENAIFMMQKRKMYVSQRKEVKQQKDEAEEYQMQQEELRELRTDQVMWQIWRIKRGLDEHNDACQVLRDKLASVKGKEDAMDRQIASQKQELAKSSKAVASAEKDYKSRRKALEAVSPQLEALIANHKSQQKRLVEAEKSKVLVQSDRVAQVQSKQKLSDEISELAEEEHQVARRLSELESRGVKLDARKLEEYARLRQEVAAKSSAEKAQLDSLLGDIASKQQQVQRLTSQIEAFNSELQLETKQAADYTLKRQRLETGLAQAAVELAELKASRDSAIAESDRDAVLQAQYERELQEVARRLSEAGDDRRRSKQEEKMLEAIGTMQRVFTGVYGRLSDLCKPIQRKYATAIAVTAGRHMDAIVVESKQVAAECIRYLRDQRIGSCMFLPLDNITSAPVSERLRSLGSNFRLCVDLVESDERFKSAILYALGSTVVCDSLEEAQELSFGRGETVKVVTLKGHVISKSGAMTGGQINRDGDHDRWEEREVDTLRKRKVELDELILGLKQNFSRRQVVADLETRLKLLQTRVQYSEADLKVVSGKISQTSQQIRLKQESIDRLQSERAALVDVTKELEVKSATVASRLREVEEVVFGAFSLSVGVANIREYEDSNLRLHKELSQKRTRLQERISVLTAQLEYEEKRDFEGALQRLQTQVEGIKKDIAAAEKQRISLEDKELSSREALRAAQAQLTAATKLRDEIMEKMKQTQRAKVEVTTERDNAAKRLAGEEILGERFRAQLHETLQKALVEEVSLPVIDEDDDSSAHSDSIEGSLLWTGSQSSSKRSRADEADGGDSSTAPSHSHSRHSSSSSRQTSDSMHFSQGDHPAVVRDRKKAARVNLSSMKIHEKLSQAQIVDKESELAANIEALVRSLEDKQPNMHAVERYESVLDKLRESTEELESAKEVAREIALNFESIKSKRQQLFQDCFKHVSEALGVIYKDLTRSSRHPMGGHAYLTLENTDEPYLSGIRFIAMPPMKRFRDMDQLSGGEKTMAALALLFSIHSFRQAPFFVLDEVDAALDNVNVKKICNYIKQRSHDFQCVVISLKDMFYEHADSLVGICKDVDSLSSRVLTLGLKQFEASSLEVGDADQSSTPQSSRASSITSSVSHSRGPASVEREVELGKRKAMPARSEQEHEQEQEQEQKQEQEHSKHRQGPSRKRGSQ